MAQPNSTFIDEMVAAARGCVALLLGKRDAPAYFDFSQRGLVGSLLAVVVAMALAGFGPTLLGVPLPPGAATQSIVVNTILFAAQALTAYLALRQMGRQDGFVPYFVASNWITLASAVLLLISTIFGAIGVVLLIGVVVFAVATFINIGRFIVTLTPLQIGLLFLSQMVGVLAALAMIAVIFPPPMLP